MAKVVNVNLSKEEFEKFCKVNGLDPNHKMSKLRFVAKFNKDAKEALEKIESGKIDLDRVEIVDNFDEVKNSDNVKPDEPSEEDYKIGARCILKGIAYIMGAKDKWKEKNPLDDLSDKGQSSIGFALSEQFGEEFLAITECILKGCAFTKVMDDIEKETQGGKKENKKND